jgi:hypothetical protein
MKLSKYVNLVVLAGLLDYTKSNFIYRVGQKYLTNFTIQLKIIHFQ